MAAPRDRAPGNISAVEEDVAADVIRRLEALGVEYCITGSEALPRYGEPRQTADIDLLLAMPVHEFDRIRKAFQADYVVNEPIDAQGRAMASVVAQSGLGKADLIIGRHDAWARSAMKRREAWDHPRLGRVWVLSLEDLILAKLEWSGGVSELQLRDCANLLRTNAGNVDWTYLERFARVLGVDHTLARLRAATA
jgi:hypothetical protein